MSTLVLESTGGVALPWLWVVLLAVVPFRGWLQVSSNLMFEMLRTLQASAPGRSPRPLGRRAYRQSKLAMLA